MSKFLAKAAFYFVVVASLIWTSTLTYSFVSGVLPNTHWIVPIFALVVFDAGMIAWMVVFLDYAEGAGQRGIAIVTCLFDFLGVGLMALAEVFLGGQTMAQAPTNLGEYALWGIPIWTVLNVGAAIAFHLLSPDAIRKMAVRGEMDKVFKESIERLQTKRAAISGQLSSQMADGMLSKLVADLAADANNDGIPDVFQPAINAARQETKPSPPTIVSNGKNTAPFE